MVAAPYALAAEIASLDELGEIAPSGEVARERVTHGTLEEGALAVVQRVEAGDDLRQLAHSLGPGFEVVERSSEGAARFAMSMAIRPLTMAPESEPRDGGTFGKAMLPDVQRPSVAGYAAAKRSALGVADEDPEDEGGSWLNGRWGLIVAVVLVLIVREVVPFGRELLYPLTLFATWVHEMGHGLTALVVGGSFDSLEIFWNASGLAHGAVAEGWPTALRAIGGLLAPPIVGAAILAFARGPKRGTIVLWVLAGLMLLSVPIWIRSVTGFVVIPLVALVTGALAYKGGETIRHLGAQLLGVVLGLDTVTRIDYLFTGEVRIAGQPLPSDVQHVATAIGGHYLLWGALLAAISVGLVYLGVRIAWMDEVAWPKLRWPKRSKDVTSSAGGRSNL